MQGSNLPCRGLDGVDRRMNDAEQGRVVELLTWLQFQTVWIPVVPRAGFDGPLGSQLGVPTAFLQLGQPTLISQPAEQRQQDPQRGGLLLHPTADGGAAQGHRAGLNPPLRADVGQS